MSPAPLGPALLRICRRAGAFAGLAALAVAFRIPPLLNARGLHSDAAIVGLQAQHFLGGELSWFIWGAGYQSSLDAALIAASFAFFGVSALAMMVVPLLGHLALMGFTFSTLARRVGSAGASLCVLPLVFTPEAINGVALYPPRQWCLTAVVGAVWLLDRASAGRGQAWRFSVACFVAVLPLCLDTYALQFTVAVGFFAAACTWDDQPERPQWRQRAIACAVGVGAGLAVFFLFRHLPGHGPTRSPLSFRHLGSNARLLWAQCLPWLLGYRVFVPGGSLLPAAWEPPLWLHWVQGIGAASVGAGILGAGALALRKGEWGIRRLAGLAFLSSASAIAGFLLSPLPRDMWGARYLAPILWTAPFALVAWLPRLGGRRFAVALAPYLLTAAIGGWVSYGPYVRGPVPVRDARGTAEEEMAVARALRTRGVRFATAQYWLAHRLTFLWGEDPIVVPFDPEGDRYHPYRQGFEAAQEVAYVFHPSEPRALPEDSERDLRQAGVPFERLQVAGFTVLVAQRVDGGVGAWPQGVERVVEP